MSGQDHRVAGLVGSITRLAEEVDAVVYLRLTNGVAAPAVYRKGDGLDASSIALHTKYPMSSIVMRLQAVYRDAVFGVVARGCDVKACVEISKEENLDLDRVRFIRMTCTLEETEACQCSPPAHFGTGECAEENTGEDTGEDSALAPNGPADCERTPVRHVMSDLSGKSSEERLAHWQEQLSKCIKCYGCRNICPVCNCDACMLEDAKYVPKGELPPQALTFHLIRAYHVADKCVACGECEHACPVGIPLLSLHKLIREDMGVLFGYAPGDSVERRTPLISTLEEDPINESPGWGLKESPEGVGQ